MNNFQTDLTTRFKGLNYKLDRILPSSKLKNFNTIRTDKNPTDIVRNRYISKKLFSEFILFKIKDMKKLSFLVEHYTIKIDIIRCYL